MAIDPISTYISTDISTDISTQLNDWFPDEQQQPIIEQLSQQVGLTRVRATYFVRLWVLRQWASSQYPSGMRVLRRADNLNPVGFYLMYPTAYLASRTYLQKSAAQALADSRA